MQTNDACWQDFKQTVQANFGLVLSSAQISQFQMLYELLTKANQTTNLTRITSLKDFCMLHLLDSLTLLSCLALESKASLKIIDIGSGAGFPALPLAVATSHHVVAVESSGKKAQFIQQAAEALGLSNLTVIPERSETVAHQQQYREQYDIATARAVASLAVLTELCLPFVKTGGIFLAMKTQTALDTEIKQAEAALKLLGGTVQEVLPVTLPQLSNRAIVVIRKTQTVPRQYPRNPGLPAKKPL